VKLQVQFTRSTYQEATKQHHGHDTNRRWPRVAAGALPSLLSLQMIVFAGLCCYAHMLFCLSPITGCRQVCVGCVDGHLLALLWQSLRSLMFAVLEDRDTAQAAEVAAHAATAAAQVSMFGFAVHAVATFKMLL